MHFGARAEVRAHGGWTALEHRVDRRLHRSKFAILSDLDSAIFQDLEATLIINISPSLQLGQAIHVLIVSLIGPSRYFARLGIPLINNLIELLVLYLLKISDEILMPILESHVFRRMGARRHRLVAVWSHWQVLPSEDPRLRLLVGLNASRAHFHPLK